MFGLSFETYYWSLIGSISEIVLRTVQLLSLNTRLAEKQSQIICSFVISLLKLCSGKKKTCADNYELIVRAHFRYHLLISFYCYQTWIIYLMVVSLKIYVLN